MRGFARRHTVDAALAWLDAQVRPLEAEQVRLSQAAGRVLAATIESAVDVPGFDRSTMDGYAVVADDTESATPYNRVALRVVGDALPASPFMGTVMRGTTVRVMTGAPLPDGCDAVLPAEWVEHEGARGRHRRSHGHRVARQTRRPAGRGHRGRHGRDGSRTRPQAAGRWRPQFDRRGAPARRPPAARAAGHHRQRAAARGLDTAGFPHRRRQRADAGRARRAGRRDREQLGRGAQTSPMPSSAG